MMANALLNQTELLQKLGATWPDGRESIGAFATFTDEEWGGTLPELLGVLASDERLGRLLELRVFEESRELHAVRGQMGAKFSWRTAGEDDGTAAYIDDIQHLDINGKYKSSDPYAYRTMSGGVYRLPITDAERIVVRNYIDFDADGLAQIVDFRVVKLLKPVKRGED